MSHELLTLEGISHRFGTTLALDNVSFTLRAGTVHALLGENGAGKTTLMRIAYGLLRPNRGTIRMHGAQITLPSPATALARGIGMVHQHFMLVPSMTVAENVALGGRGMYSPQKARELVRTLTARTGLSVHPDERIDSLSISTQQRCEIIKALARNVSILILDEPTSLLTPDEAAELLLWLRRFADQGNAVVLITHKLRDAMSTADDFTVLRRGSVVLTTTRGTATDETLSAAMLGHEYPANGHPAETEPAVPTPAAITTNTPAAPIIASAVNVSTEQLHDLTLELHSGEIVGIAGVEGSGQHSLLRLFAGRLTPTRGAISLPNRIGFIPEDRHLAALMLDESLEANVALHGAGQRKGTISWRTLRDETTRLLQRFNVTAAGPTAAARTLSGGNQQRLVVGRELIDNPALLVAENPTRGLDFNGAAAVYTAIRTARSTGAAVLFYSSDLDEVLSIADRILVIREGKLYPIEKTRAAVGYAMLNAS